MKTAISMPDELFERAEQFARHRGLSRSELVQRAVRAYLEAHHGDLVRETLDRVYGKEPSRVDAAAALAQAEVLAPERW